MKITELVLLSVTLVGTHSDFKTVPPAGGRGAKSRACTNRLLQHSCDFGFTPQE